MSWRTWVALPLGLVLGFATLSSIQSLLVAGERSKVKRSTADAIVISRCLEAFRENNGRYPRLDQTVGQLASYLEPKYIQHLPTKDAYDNPFVVVMDGSVAAIFSTGKNGFVVEREQVTAKGPVFPLP